MNMATGADHRDFALREAELRFAPAERFWQCLLFIEEQFLPLTPTSTVEVCGFVPLALVDFFDFTQGASKFQPSSQTSAPRFSSQQGEADAADND